MTATTTLTPQTSIGRHYEGRTREAAAVRPSLGTGIILSKSPAVYTSKQRDYFNINIDYNLTLTGVIFYGDTSSDTQRCGNY